MSARRRQRAQLLRRVAFWLAMAVASAVLLRVSP